MSDTYGHNPQHDFGDVFGTRSSPLIPFWRLEGDALANEEFVRLVPDRQSKMGAAWNEQVNRFQEWEVTVKLRINGVSQLGADGLAFWYTRESSLKGTFFGFVEKFTGLGVVIDTYDNDDTGLHPLLVALLNDGTKEYTHSGHGGHGNSKETPNPVERKEMEIGYCQIHVRNLPEPSYMRISYEKKELKVETDLFGTGEYQLCLLAKNVELPSGYRFGFTAATGQLADNHDIYGFSVINLDSNAQAIDSQRIYSSQEKYMISEMLSRVHYESLTTSRALQILSTKQAAPGIVGAGVPSASQDLGTHFVRIEERLAGLENSLRALPSGTAAAGQQSAEVLAAEVRFKQIKSDLQELRTGVNGLSKDLMDLKNAQGAARPVPANLQFGNLQPPSGTSWLWTFLYIVMAAVMVGVCYIGILFIRIQREKSKKHF